MGGFLNKENCRRGSHCIPLVSLSGRCLQQRGTRWPGERSEKRMRFRVPRTVPPRYGFEIGFRPIRAPLFILISNRCLSY